MGLSGEIIVGGLPPTMRPIFEPQPVLLRLKVVPTTLASRSPSLIWPEIAEFGTTIYYFVFRFFSRCSRHVSRLTTMKNRKKPPTTDSAVSKR